MHDSDGPVIAQAIYRIFTQYRSKSIPFDGLVKTLADGYSLAISKPLQKEDLHKIFHVILPLALQRPTAADFPYRTWVDQGFSAVSSEPLPDSAAQTIEKSVIGYIDSISEYTSNSLGLSVALVVDGVVRQLRIAQKLPPSRWATFVHVGV